MIDNTSAARCRALLVAGTLFCYGGAAHSVAEGMPKRLLCTFGAGTLSSYDRGAFIDQKAEQLSFALDAIDLDGQAAKLVARAGAEPGSVRVIRALNANHFLEVANEGFLNLTTIYDRDPVSGTHPAVHSRHLGLLGQPVYGHYTGQCRPE